MPDAEEVIEFSRFRLDLSRSILESDGAIIQIRLKSFTLLCFLAQNPNRVLSRDDLIAAVWGRIIVSDDVVTQTVRDARRAIGDGNGSIIKTIPRRGYLFAPPPPAPREIGLQTGEASTPAAERRNSLPTSIKPTIAVLPFANLSGDTTQQHFCDGLTEDITAALSKLRSLFVIASNSTSSYKATTFDVRHIAQDLGVRYIVEGSFRKSGEQLRVSSQLIDATQGNQVWSERYDRPLGGIFELQDDITARIVSSVEPELYAAERARLRQTQPADLDAWGSLIRALSHIWKLTREDNEKALGFLSAAIEDDPSYARAMGLKAWVSLFNAHMGWASMSETLASAEGLAQAAIAQDREDPWAHLAIGCAHMFARRHEDAIEALQLALDINPNFSIGYACLGLALAYGGNGGEAVAAFDKAMRLSPRDPFAPQIAAARSFAHYIAGEYEEGLRWGQRAVRDSPNVSGYWRAVALSAAMLGQTEAAGAAVSRARQLQPDFSVAWVEQESPLVSEAQRYRYAAILVEAGLPRR